MKKLSTPHIVLTALILILAAQSAFAGDLYRLDMRYEGPVPDYPAQIVIEVWEGGQCDHFKGTASADFDGVNMTNNVDDSVISIDAITDMGSSLAIDYTVHGYDTNHDPPKFKANTCFVVQVNDATDGLTLHTSCSQPILVNHPYSGDAGGVFTILGGDGDCLDDGTTPEDCPFDDKLYWIAGEFRVPCSSPGDVTLTVYDSDHFDDPEGAATGYFDGNNLTDVTNDDVALLMGALIDGGELVVYFEAFGFEHFPPRFKASTSFEIVVGGCDTFRLVRYHTSCSQPIVLFEPQAASPAGAVTFTDFCGCEEGTVPIENKSWGDIKSLYR